MSCTSCSTTTGAAQQLFASALNFFAASQCFIANDPTSEYAVPNQTTFDFIIVGAGSAGSVVANRLSEICDWNILLLEAGPKPPIESEIPFMDLELYKSGYDWGYVIKNNGVTQQALKNGEMLWPRGKMLGGCSSMNAMFYVRGSDCDFDSWAEDGLPSWTSENVNYYFRKAENIRDLNLENNPRVWETYGHEGPLNVNTYNGTYRNVTQKVIDSWKYIGMNEVPDFNAATYEGYGMTGLTRMTVQNGQRQSTYEAYLKPVTNRSNLKIVTNAFVTKILINKDTQAYGVEVDVNGKQQTFYANLEVIISGGAINTPQLLMLSGIGPKEHLLSKNITCLVDLPGVGKNLQDHSFTPIFIYGDELRSEFTSNQFFDVIKYLYNKTGYLAHGCETDVMAFFSRVKDMPYPEFQSHLIMLWKNSSVARQYLNLIFKDDVVDSITKHNSDKALFLFPLHLLHPSSKGFIALNTSNPYDHPIIKPNYFEDNTDSLALVDAIKIMTNLLYTPYFESINAFIPRIHLPQCNDYEFLSDLYWECYVIHMSYTVYHPLGTAKMGTDPLDAVVDNFLKVYEVKNLRVIDASIMPSQTSGNTNAPAIMVGELGSDMIKAEHLGNQLFNK